MWVGLFLAFVGFVLLAFLAFVVRFVASWGSGGCSVVGIALNARPVWYV